MNDPSAIGIGITFFMIMGRRKEESYLIKIQGFGFWKLLVDL